MTKNEPVAWVSYHDDKRPNPPHFSLQPTALQGYRKPVPLYSPADMAATFQAGMDTALYTQAAKDLIAERTRQIEVEGWAHEHDDEHVLGEIAALAAFYAVPDGVRDWDFSSTGYGDTLADALLPNGWTATAGDDRRRDLVRAGALILAEIERLDRAARVEHGPSVIEPPAAYGCGGDPLDDARYDDEMRRATATLAVKEGR